MSILIKFISLSENNPAWINSSQGVTASWQPSYANCMFVKGILYGNCGLRSPFFCDSLGNEIIVNLETSQTRVRALALKDGESPCLNDDNDLAISCGIGVMQCRFRRSRHHMW